MENYIIYGNEFMDKYKMAINICKKENLNIKFNRKYNIHIGDNIHSFNISDTHIEVDFELLGTNEYNIWIELYSKLITFNTKYIVICINFDMIKSELIEIFHTFMRTNKLSYIICTKDISFITDEIKNKCKILSCKIKSNNKCISYEHLIVPIYTSIIECDINYRNIRNNLYKLLIYNIDIHKFFTDIITSAIKDNIIEDIDEELLDIICKYNNNYRSICHLEAFVYYFIIKKQRVK